MPKRHKIGYRKPPKETQFVKGQSGNAKGRPKGSKNLSTLFANIASAKITVTENGRTRIITRKEAIILQLANKALSGELRSMKEFISLLRLAETTEDSLPVDIMPSERDGTLMKSILARMSRMSASTEVEAEEDAAESSGEESSDEDVDE